MLTFIPYFFQFRSLWRGANVDALIFCDYFTDLVFFIDIFIHFKTSYLDKGIPKTEPKLIRRVVIPLYFLLLTHLFSTTLLDGSLGCYFYNSN